MLHLSGKIRKFYKSYQLLLFGNSRSIKTIELEGQVSEIFSAPFENVFDRSLGRGSKRKFLIKFYQVDLLE